MYQEESIFNLVQREIADPIRTPVYKSNFPYDIAPTASTFLLKNSSFPNVANLNGAYSFPRGAHPLKASYGTIGKPNGENKRDPNNFIKKGHQYKITPKAEKLRNSSDFKKPAVPTLSDKPIMGLKSDKNFINSNAVDVILMSPRYRKSEEIDFLKKDNYGKTPKYISKLKDHVENEYRSIREMQMKNKDEENSRK